MLQENETFLTLRNLKTLLAKTTERFSLYESENSSVKNLFSLECRSLSRILEIKKTFDVK